MMNQAINWVNLEAKRWSAGTTTRQGGVSKPPFHSWNLAFHTGDDPLVVSENRRHFAQAVNLPSTQMVFTYQSHSTVLKKVTSKDASKGTKRYEDGVAADALYTEERNLLLAIFHADCVPVFLLHKSRPLTAIIHAGTPGSLNKITQKVMQQLILEAGIHPREMIAYLGPALDFAHHPISQQRQTEILTMDPHYQNIIKIIGDQRYLDIPLLNYLQLVDAGMQPRDIHVSNLDTYSNPETYFSYDRDGKTGRHLSFVYLR